MRSRLFLTAVFFTLVLVVIYVFFIKAASNSDPLHSQTSPTRGGSSSSAPAAQLDQDSAGPSATDTQKEESLQQFEKWFRGEASSLEEQTSTSSKNEALIQRARTLQQSEINRLKDVSLSFESTANERILATYILTLNPSRAGKALADIAAAPLKIKGDSPPHSVQETLSLQEKALRRMAIEALVKEAKNSSGGKALVDDTRSRMKDPGLIKYMDDLTKGSR